jgi:hypothetical protein
MLRKCVKGVEINIHALDYDPLGYNTTVFNVATNISEKPVENNEN